MLQGKNKIQLNQATMREIVQYYLTNVLFNKDKYSPIVTEVTLNGQVFDITLDSSEQIRDSK